MAYSNLMHISKTIKQILFAIVFQTLSKIICNN